MPEPAVPQDNPATPEGFAYGRHLFYDPRLSGNGEQSCADCHEPARAFTDAKTTPTGSTGDVIPRNSLALVNVAWNGTYTWPNPLLTTFVRGLVSSDSPYDRYQYGGDTSAMSPEARRGMALFFAEKTECYHCHGGVNFSVSFLSAETTTLPEAFFNTGLYNIGGTGDYPKPEEGAAAPRRGDDTASPTAGGSGASADRDGTPVSALAASARSRRPDRRRRRAVPVRELHRGARAERPPPQRRTGFFASFR